MVRHDRDDLPEPRRGAAGRDADDAVVVVEPLDDGIGISRDRAVALEEARPVLGQRLGAGIEDDVARDRRADHGRGDICRDPVGRASR